LDKKIKPYGLQTGIPSDHSKYNVFLIPRSGSCFSFTVASRQRKRKKYLCVLCVSNERSEWAVSLCLNKNGLISKYTRSEKILFHPLSESVSQLTCCTTFTPAAVI